MTTKWIWATGFALSLVSAAHAQQPAQSLALFASEAEAHSHCPGDRVVRVDLPEGFYLHGDRGFGGASLDKVFVCARQAFAVFGPPAGRR